MGGQTDGRQPGRPRVRSSLRPPSRRSPPVCACLCARARPLPALFSGAVLDGDKKVPLRSVPRSVYYRDAPGAGSAESFAPLTSSRRAARCPPIPARLRHPCAPRAARAPDVIGGRRCRLGIRAPLTSSRSAADDPDGLADPCRRDNARSSGAPAVFVTSSGRAGQKAPRNGRPRPYGNAVLSSRP